MAPTYQKFGWLKTWFFVVILDSRAAQIFRGLMLQTPNLRLAQILKVYQVSGPSGDVWPRLQSSEGVHHRPASLQMFELRSFADVVKRFRWDLKLSKPSGFGPISSLEFEARDLKKFGQPYWESALKIVLHVATTRLLPNWTSDQTC